MAISIRVVEGTLVAISIRFSCMMALKGKALIADLRRRLKEKQATVKLLRRQKRDLEKRNARLKEELKDLQAAFAVSTDMLADVSVRYNIPASEL